MSALNSQGAPTNSTSLVNMPLYGLLTNNRFNPCNVLSRGLNNGMSMNQVRQFSSKNDNDGSDAENDASEAAEKSAAAKTKSRKTVKSKAQKDDEVEADGTQSEAVKPTRGRKVKAVSEEKAESTEKAPPIKRKRRTKAEIEAAKLEAEFQKS